MKIFGSIYVHCSHDSYSDQIAHKVKDIHDAHHMKIMNNNSNITIDILPKMISVKSIHDKCSDNGVIDHKKCIQKCFSQYTAEKAEDLLIERYDPNFRPLGFIVYMRLIENDIVKGKNGFSGEIFQASPITIFSYEIIEFARCMRSDEFANEVKNIYDTKFPNFDIQKLSRLFKN